MTMATIDEIDIETNKQEALSLFEDCSMAIGALCVVMDKKKQIERFVALLIAIRDKSAHGEWTPWVEQNFAGKLSLRQVQRMIAEYENPKLADERKEKGRERAKATHVSLLETPREERVHGQVEVYQPYKQHQRDENAVPAEPKTNTLHKPATAKAKESDRPAPAVVTPEIVDEPDVLTIRPSDVSAIIDACLTYVPFEKLREKILPSHWALLLIQVLECVPVGDKKAAKVIRNAADRVDPPKTIKFRPPCLEEVEEFVQNKGWVGFKAKDFLEHYSLADWKYGKAKTPIKNWETAASKAWGDGKGWAADGSIRPAF